MPISPAPPAVSPERPVDPQALGHPRGTLAIVLLFGLLFGLGWLAMYVFTFLPRGAPHP
jgi:hypothetical protein